MLRVFTVGEAFEPALRGRSKYTRAYINAHPGEFPVYSASMSGPVGWIDTYDREGTYLSWTTNGYAGQMSVLSGKFSCTSDRALLAPRLPSLNLEYCAFVLTPRFRASARGRIDDGPRRNEYTKLPPAEVADIEFVVPCLDDGTPDESAQADAVGRWLRIQAFQKRALELGATIESAIVLPQLSESVPIRSVRLTDPSCFTFLRTETGWLKKHWVKLNTGLTSDYPVYSAARGPVAHVAVSHPKLIQASPEDKVLSFAVDGDGSAGSNFVLHDRDFYISTNRAAFKAAREDIDLEYVYYALQSMKADHGFGFNYKAYAAHLENVQVEFPVSEGLAFDLAMQAEQVAKLRSLYAMRESATSVLREIGKAQLTMV